MNRESFDKLEIIEQINFINKELKSDTLTNICKNIGVGRSTMSDRSKKAGYSYNKELGQYHESNANVIQSHQSITKASPKTVKRDVKPTTDGITKEMQKYRDDLMELVNYKDDILELLKYHKNNINVIDVSVLDINSLPSELQTDIINKSIKVYKKVYDLFDEVCSQNLSYKKQDMISLMIYEFYNKYKK